MKVLIGSLLIGCSYPILLILYILVFFIVLALTNKEIPSVTGIYQQFLFILISTSIISGIIGVVFLNYKKNGNRMLFGAVIGMLVQLPFLILFIFLNNFLYQPIGNFYHILWILMPPILSSTTMKYLLPRLMNTAKL